MGLLEVGHAGIVAECRHELVGADIDGVDVPGSAVEANLGESARGGSKIEHHTPAWIQLVMVEGGDEFQGAPGDPRQVFAEQVELGVGGDFFAGLSDFDAIDPDPVVGDEAFGAGPAGHEPAVDKEPVKADRVHQFQPRRSA